VESSSSPMISGSRFIGTPYETDAPLIQGSSPD
jgi:hypothetical protein